MGDDRLESYRKEVESIFGGELVSLTVYGGHAADPPAEKGYVTVLIVVRDLRREALAAYRDAARRFARQGIAFPAIFTEEFLGMKERRKVLSGRDILADVRVAATNLRHQVEFELKGKLLCLRRMYLAARGLLLLADPAAPLAKEDIVASLEARTGIPLPRMREILAAKDDRSLSGLAGEIFDGYSGEVDRLCSAVSAHPGERG